MIVVIESTDGNIVGEFETDSNVMQEQLTGDLVVRGIYAGKVTTRIRYNSDKVAIYRIQAYG